MWRGVGKIQVEWLVHFGALVNHLERVVGNRVGEIEVGCLGVDGGVVEHHRVGVEQRAEATQYAEEAVEAALSRCGASGRSHIPTLCGYGRVVVAADVPLARHQCAVASRLQNFRDRDAAVVQVALITQAEP